MIPPHRCWREQVRLVDGTFPCSVCICYAACRDCIPGGSERQRAHGVSQSQAVQLLAENGLLRVEQPRRR